MAIDATAKATQPDTKHRIIQPDISTIDMLIYNDATNNSSSKKKINREMGKRYRAAHEFAFKWFLDLGKKRECGLPYITHSLFTSLQFFGFSNGYIPINDWGRETHYFGGLAEHSVFKTIEAVANGSEFLYRKAQEDETVQDFKDSMDKTYESISRNLERAVSSNKAWRIASALNKFVKRSERNFENFVERIPTLVDFASKNLAVYFASYDILDLLESKPPVGNEIYGVVSVLHDVIEDGSRSLLEAEENLKRIENLFGTRKEDIEYGKFIAYNVDILTNKYSLILGLVEDRIKKRNFDTYFEIVDCITGRLNRDDCCRKSNDVSDLEGETLKILLLSNTRDNEEKIKSLVETELGMRYDPAYYREITRAIDNLKDHELTDATTARAAILRRIKANGKSNFDNIRDTLKDIEDGLTDEIKVKYASYFRELEEIVDNIESDPQYHQMSKQKRKEVSIFRLIKIQGYERYTDDIMRDSLTRLAEGDPYFDICPLSKMADNIDNLETMNPSKRSSIKWTLVKAAILNKRLTEYNQQVQEFYNSVDNQNNSAQLNDRYIRIHDDLIKQHRMALINSAESRKIANRNFTSLRYAISMIPYLKEKAQDYRDRFGIQHRIETVDAFKRYKYRQQRYFRNAA